MCVYNNTHITISICRHAHTYKVHQAAYLMKTINMPMLYIYIYIYISYIYIHSMSLKIHHLVSWIGALFATLACHSLFHTPLLPGEVGSFNGRHLQLELGRMLFRSCSANHQHFQVSKAYMARILHF